MNTAANRVSIIKGCRCEIEFTKEANGYAYKVWRCTGPWQRTLVCSGWSAGNLQDAWQEAEEHAAK